MRKIRLREVASFDGKVTGLVGDLLEKVSGPDHPLPSDHPLVERLADLTEQYVGDVVILLGYKPE